jgi:hypothetical protein
MRTTACAVGILLAAAGFGQHLSVAGEPTTMPAADSKTLDLSAAKFLVGEWALDAKWANGSPLVARASYAYENDGTAIAGRTFVIDDKGGEKQRDLTVFAMKEGTLHQIVFHQDGSTRVTPARPGDGGAIVFEWVKPASAPGKADIPIRQVWTPIDADHWRWQSFSQLKGEWHSSVDGVWTRKPS